MTIRDSIKSISPPWLAEGTAEKYLYMFGLTLDGFAENKFQGNLARFPLFAEDDALAITGGDLLIVRGPTEPTGSYAGRLSVAYDSWRRAGNVLVLLQQLRSFFSPDVPVVRGVSNSSVWDWFDPGWSHQHLANWNWDGDAASFWRVWLVVYPTGAMPLETFWGDGHTWGDGRAWGWSGTPEQVDGAKSIVRQWQRPGSRIPYLLYAYDPATLGPYSSAGDLPDGTWASWAKIVGGAWVPTRFSSMAVWRLDGT